MSSTSDAPASEAVIDGILTRYAVAGSGPPLLMFSPGGFNATMANWETHGIYQRTAMLARLRERFTCITFDKRESGGSGGRVERVRWLDYAHQGLGLLDHLGYQRAYVMGACVGCSIATVLATVAPDRVAGAVLYSPAGGVQYRAKQHARFHAHLAYAAENGLRAVAALAYSTDGGFSDDGRVGPWVAVLRSDHEFAARYVDLDPAGYQVIVAGMCRLLFDRDTVPGAEPEDLLTLNVPALIVPGNDSSHAPSAAHYLRECLRGADFWDAPVAAQTAETAPARVIDFLQSLPG
jgi:pimeloyl-ACP methyl ester carboxylesterase